MSLCNSRCKVCTSTTLHVTLLAGKKEEKKKECNEQNTEFDVNNFTRPSDWLSEPWKVNAWDELKTQKAICLASHDCILSTGDSINSVWWSLLPVPGESRVLFSSTSSSSSSSFSLHLASLLFLLVSLFSSSLPLSPSPLSPCYRQSLRVLRLLFRHFKSPIDWLYSRQDDTHTHKRKFDTHTDSLSLSASLCAIQLYTWIVFLLPDAGACLLAHMFLRRCLSCVSPFASLKLLVFSSLPSHPFCPSSCMQVKKLQVDLKIH